MSGFRSSQDDANQERWLTRLKHRFHGLRKFSAELSHIPPDLGEIYNRSAQHNSPDRTPIVVIPGFLGSVLRQRSTGKVVWGEFSRAVLNPETPEGARLFALPMQPGVPLKALRDDVFPVETLSHIGGDLFGVPLHLSAYSRLMLALGVGGFRDQQLAQAGVIDYGDDHFTCFQFAYDWRRDIVESARHLHTFVLARCEYVREQYRTRFGLELEQVKVNLVAHSMGGLIARYYLLYGDADLPEDGSLPPVTWAGARYVNKVILVGSPNGGALESLEDLIMGSPFPPGFPKYQAALLGTMPSVYQLLPRLRHRPVRLKHDPSQTVDIFNPQLWRHYGWGLMDARQDQVLQWLCPNTTSPEERQTIAFDHLAKVLSRTQHLAAALDRPATPPEGLSLQLVAGDSVPTQAAVSLDEKTGNLELLEEGPGDGTVLRRNALLDERTEDNWTPTLQSPIPWQRVTFLFTDHLGLTRDPTFIDNLLFELLEAPSPPMPGWGTDSNLSEGSTPMI